MPKSIIRQDVPLQQDVLLRQDVSLAAGCVPTAGCVPATGCAPVAGCVPGTGCAPAASTAATVPIQHVLSQCIHAPYNCVNHRHKSYWCTFCVSNYLFPDIHCNHSNYVSRVMHSSYASNVCAPPVYIPQGCAPSVYAPPVCPSF